jgi:hypothetical protein
VITNGSTATTPTTNMRSRDFRNGIMCLEVCQSPN